MCLYWWYLTIRIERIRVIWWRIIYCGKQTWSLITTFPRQWEMSIRYSGCLVPDGKSKLSILLYPRRIEFSFRHLPLFIVFSSLVFLFRLHLISGCGQHYLWILFVHSCEFESPFCRYWSAHDYYEYMSKFEITVIIIYLCYLLRLFLASCRLVLRWIVFSRTHARDYCVIVILHTAERVVYLLSIINCIRALVFGFCACSWQRAILPWQTDDLRLATMLNFQMKYNFPFNIWN